LENFGRLWGALEAFMVGTELERLNITLADVRDMTLRYRVYSALKRYDLTRGMLEKVVELIEEERESCAKICEKGIETARIVKAEGLISIDSVMKVLAEEIRARSNQ
jgi:hypothetical protein